MERVYTLFVKMLLWRYCPCKSDQGEKRNLAMTSASGD